MQKLAVVATRKPVGSYIALQVEKGYEFLMSDASHESIVEGLAHISSSDLYMATRHSHLWNQTGMVGVCGTILQERFKQTGAIDEISNAISAHQRAVQLTPDGHADMPSLLNNLGGSLLCRFERTGDLADVTNAISAHQKAVQLTPDGHANMPIRLSNLVGSLSRRFECTGDPTNVANAISALQRAVQLIPDGHADMPGLLNNLGGSLTRRFDYTGDLTDISNAISALQRAVQLTSDGHADMPSQLNNLGNSLLCRFERTGDLTDISNAISAQQRAVQLTSNDHADMPTRLSNLGGSLSRRFERTGDLNDISNAISVRQRAVQLTPGGHAEMRIRLSNLGGSLSRRFERTGDLTDVANAISALERAVQLTPNGHTAMPNHLSTIGGSLLRRFERTGNLNDISNAISALQRAVQLTPDGHAGMPSQLSNLGASLLRRFERTGDFSDNVAATSSYRQSAIHKFGPPLVRLAAAQSWAKLSVSHNPSDSLRAYDVAVNLLSQIAGMDRTIQQRHSSLVDISRLTATAASAAFAQEEVGKALEWLEQGRCLVWSQLNQLRTPVDDLRTHNHLLADRFLDVSRALESSGSRQAFTPLAIDGTMLQKIALEDEARTHVLLARDWDQLLKEIRGIPGFSNFLQPRRASSIMKDLPRDGPTILINVHKARCDALALMQACDQPLHIPLEHFTHKDASELKDRLRRYLLSQKYIMRDADRGPREFRDPEENGDLHEILQELWLRVVKPILDALSYSVGPILAHNIQSHSFAKL